MIGERIKKYRKHIHMSQAELGAALGLSQGAISQWENGGSKPDINTIKDLAEIFGVSVLDLTGDVDAASTDMQDDKITAAAKTLEDYIVLARGDFSIEKYRRLSPENKRIIDDMVNRLFELSVGKE